MLLKRDTDDDRFPMTHLSINGPLEYLNISACSPYQISDNRGVPLRLHRGFNYFVQFKGFINVSLLFTVLNCAFILSLSLYRGHLSLHSNPFSTWSFNLSWHSLLLCRWDMFCLTAKDKTHWNHLLVQLLKNSIWPSSEYELYSLTGIHFF